MLAVLSDPAKSQARLSEMLEARLAWVAAHETAIAAMRESDAKVAANLTAIAKAPAEHSAKLKAASEAHDSRYAQWHGELNARDIATKKLNEAAAADREAAAKLKADFESRIAIIKQAGV
jgi:hypothetical protein